MTGIDRPADLVFDLDGTISDPLAGIARCINYALRCHRLAEVSEPRIAELIGPPLDQAFRALLPDADESRVGSLVAKYRERYALSGYAENSMYEGILEALTRLSASGLRLGVCTSKRVDFAEKILQRFEIRQLFSFVDGGDVGISKTQQLSGLIGGGRVGEGSKMIGDRAVDIVAANENGLGSIGVLWGYGTQAELQEAKPDAILERTSDLMRLAAPA